MSVTDLSHFLHVDLLSTQELLSLPPVRWLMQGLIPENGLVGLVGQPAEGKSFVALDWAMCISEGMPWLGQYVTKQAPVIYIAAEGGRGIQKRVKAWMLHHGVQGLDAMYWLLNPLYVREAGIVEAFLEELEHLDIYPGLVVMDTLSRSFGSGEENASSDMGGFVDAVTRLAAGRQMSALVVHHMNATGGRERGHTSFKGALDAMHTCRAEKNGDGHIIRLSVENTKQKDAAETPIIYCQPIEGVKESLVFEWAAAPEKKPQGNREPAPMRKIDMVRVLGSAENGLMWNEWRLACGGLPKSSFSRRVKQLLEDGEVVKDQNGRFFVAMAVLDIAELGAGDDAVPI